MSDREPFLGHAVEHGVPRFTSPSALERYDPRSGGCPLKWWYRYVCRIKDAPSDSKDSGIKLHAEIERHEKTGARDLSSLALSGLHMVPDPGADLLVEQPIYTVSPSGISSLLHADKIPVIAKVDCAHDRGINKGGDEISERFDPPGTIEILDWKWKRDGRKLEYFLQPGELIKSIQMSGYGLALGRRNNASYVRLSHGYFPSMGARPFKVTKLHVLDDCARSWEYAEGLGRAMRDVAREPNPSKVPANVHACGAYGGCPHREICPAYKRDSLAGIFGETGAKEIKAMGLIATVAPQVGAPTVTVQGPVATIDPRAQLAAEEAAMRQQAVQTYAGILPGFPEAVQRIQQSGRGFPALGGAAAQMYGALNGQTLPTGAGYAGGGELGRINFMDPAHVVQLGNELAGVATQPTPQPVVAPAPVQPAPVVQQVQHFTMPVNVSSPLAPDAPQSNPAFAAKPLEATPGLGLPVMQFAMQTMPQPTTTTQASPMLVQTAPAPMSFTMPSQTIPGAQVTVAPAEAPKKRGRKPKAQQGTPVAPGAVEAPKADGYEVFIDCVPNDEYESLHPYLDAILAALVTKFCPPPCLPDVRCAPRESALGFGGWKGAIRAMVLEQPPQLGRCFIDTRDNEAAAGLADAMRVVCERRDDLCVKGIR